MDAHPCTVPNNQWLFFVIYWMEPAWTVPPDLRVSARMAGFTGKASSLAETCISQQKNLRQGLFAL